MASPLKFIVGSLVGAGIGVIISKAVEQRQEPGLSAAAAFAGDKPESGSTADAVKERMVRAKLAGETARAAKEAELRAFFRDKVHRPDALTNLPES